MKFQAGKKGGVSNFRANWQKGVLEHEKDTSNPEGTDESFLSPDEGLPEDTYFIRKVHVISSVVHNSKWLVGKVLLKP